MLQLRLSNLELMLVTSDFSISVEVVNIYLHGVAVRCINGGTDGILADAASICASWIHCWFF